MVHTLRVTLRDVSPDVWRRLIVTSETTLPKLAQVLERVMGWDSYHLHMFDVGGIQFGAPDEEFDIDNLIDHRKVTVKQVLPRVGSALRFDYDFGRRVGARRRRRGDRGAAGRQAVPGLPRRGAGMSSGGLRRAASLRRPGRRDRRSEPS